LAGGLFFENLYDFRCNEDIPHALSTLDPEVELFVSRDLDSRFSAREEAAVAEWVESVRALHAMGDHPWHPVPMLGGGWGALLTDEEVRGHWRSSWTQILKD
jgi:hypothetical protein